MSIVGTKEWDEAVNAYIKAREAGTPEGWAHADCDHGNGYCTETVSNTFQPSTN
jgi:hypothetical protein